MGPLKIIVSLCVAPSPAGYTDEKIELWLMRIPRSDKKEIRKRLCLNFQSTSKTSLEFNAAPTLLFHLAFYADQAK